eukprot:GFUD01123718.1.p1 GENE.GFUD01123718.1~~GFUD01123718.1.p1  ORF type:complete len:112 (+),score=30.82 GFUD01123718.1:177-512(+)
MSTKEEEKFQKMFQSFETDEDGTIIRRDFFLSLFAKSNDGVLTKEDCLRLSFRLFSVGEDGGIQMKEASDLWSWFDIYETTQDRELERIEEDMFMKKSLSRMENIKLQHNM